MTVSHRQALLILGMHRSGTSALTRALSLLGADLPVRLMLPKADDNALGFWEPQDVYALNEQLLAALDSRWDDWRPLPSPDAEWLQPWRHQQQEILRSNYPESALALIKDPRLCRLAPYWEDALQSLQFAPCPILTLRHPLEVADSLQRRDGFTLRHGLLLWLRHMLDAERYSRPWPRALIRYSDLLQDWPTTLSRAGAQLGLTWPRSIDAAQADITAFLSPDHRHHARDPAELDSHPEVDTWVRAAFAQLERLQADPHAPSVLQALDQIRAEFDAACAVFGPEWFGADQRAREHSQSLATLNHSLQQKSTAVEGLQGRLQTLQAACDRRDTDLRQQQQLIDELRAAVAAEKERRAQVQHALDALRSEHEQALAREQQQALALKQEQQRSTALQAQLKAEEQAHKAAQAQLRKVLESRIDQLKAESQRWERLSQQHQALAQGRRRALQELSRQLPQAAAPAQGALSLRVARARLGTPQRWYGEWRELQQIRVSALFDRAWYLRTYPDVARAGLDPLLHWLYRGWYEGRQPAAGFDVDWYLQTYPDVRAAGHNPLLHYLRHGWQEGRQPCALFEPRWYLEAHPDVAAAGLEPLGHYLQSGRHEQRRPSLWFDAAWYAQRESIPASEAWLHYFDQATTVATSPSAYFDAPWYQQRYPDLQPAPGELFRHYAEQGARELRDPNPWFAAAWYAQRHPAAQAHPLRHFIAHSRTPGVDPSPRFSVQAYISRYPELRENDIEPLWHFLAHGADEGRNPSPQRSMLDQVRQIQNPPVAAPQSQVVHAVEPLTAERLREAEAAVRAQPPGAFSIIMPTWNRRETLPRAIRSVLAQSYTDWTLLICDDGSTDDSISLIQQEFATDVEAGRIQILALPHAGVSAARNAGLAAARGDWVAYLDSDNGWHPDYLLLCAAAYARQPECATHYAGLQVHDSARDREFVRCRSFDWADLLRQNYIDLNVFSHARRLTDQLGGFDESLTRLVDWELILRLTRLYPPAWSPYVLADYYVAESLDNITLREPLERNELAVRRRFLSMPVRSVAELKLAYVLWDWPALSQTFVMAELHELLRQGVDVRVYFHTAPDRALSQPPALPTTQVSSAEELAAQLRQDGRNWIHAHFAYPAVTQLVWPAAEATGIPFSFMPHAVDIFHHANRQRNRIAEVSASPCCARLMVHGEFHRDFLVRHGVPAEKISFTPQACDLSALLAAPWPRATRVPGRPLQVVAIGRLIEKKGFSDLLEAAALCQAPLAVRIYGYGPLQEALAAQITALGLDQQVQLCGGYEGDTALAEILSQADLLCLPCVEAANGDVDGMPTVLFEAMAAGVPVLSTRVAAIPEFIADGINGFLVEPRQPAALAARLDALSRMSADMLQAVARTARDQVQQRVGPQRTVDVLLDVAARPPLDIFMVTFLRDHYGNQPATERAIRSVLENTTTPFVLTVVDNASAPEQVLFLQQLAAQDPRIRLLLLPDNRYCGPASNLAIQMARSDMAIYVCSNEGYIVRRGWERGVLGTMREHPKAALGGHRVSSPKWYDGKTYAAQDWLDSFRNADFARSNPERAFWHVQGGLFALRTRVVQSCGGFSPQRPQDLMDVELSFYLESLGHELLDIPGILALSNKTRPNLDAMVDETAVALHPVFEQTLDLLPAAATPARCNVCGWQGEIARGPDLIAFDCPQCASSPRDRMLYRALADSNLHHRGLRLPAADFGEATRKVLESMFRWASAAEPADVDLEALPRSAASMTLGIPPTLITSIPERPACNICGHREFGAGPGGRMSVEGDRPPRCTGCQSLERHRAFRAATQGLGPALFQGRRVLQFSADPALPASWPETLEVSIYGGSNSLDLQAIDRPDRSYDIVICNHVLEHVADDQQALRELVRITRPSGFVFLSVPDPLRVERTRDWGHPDERQHGHYRVYGRDLHAQLRATLPDTCIIGAQAADPCTGTREAYFLLTENVELAQRWLRELPGAIDIHA